MQYALRKHWYVKFCHKISLEPGLKHENSSISIQIYQQNNWSISLFKRSKEHEHESWSGGYKELLQSFTAVQWYIEGREKKIGNDKKKDACKSKDQPYSSLLDT